MNDELKSKKGKTAGIIACCLAVVGILFFGTVFVPLSAIVAVFGTIISVKNKNSVGIGINILAWILIIIGFITSPILLALIGFGASASSIN